LAQSVWAAWRSVVAADVFCLPPRNAALITTTGFKKALSSRLLGFSLSIGRGLVMSFGMNTPQVLAGLLAAAAIMPVAQAQNQVVNVYNWAEYTAPDTLSGFQKATGITVRYDVYDNNDTLQAKLLTGKSGYDVVVPSTHYAARQIEGGLFQKLDKSQIPNWSHLD